MKEGGSNYYFSLLIFENFKIVPHHSTRSKNLRVNIGLFQNACLIKFNFKPLHTVKEKSDLKLNHSFSKQKVSIHFICMSKTVGFPTISKEEINK